MIGLEYPAQRRYEELPAVSQTMWYPVVKLIVQDGILCAVVDHEGTQYIVPGGSIVQGQDPI